MQYRSQTAKYIQSLFPKVNMLGLNAGVSGTGADLGACRLQEQLLQYKPDLVFIEFAVNGAFAPGVEGIVRQIRKFDPQTDICLVYTISSGQAAIYAMGAIPENIKALEKIADRYSLPSVHMGLSIGHLQQKGLLLWKGTAQKENRVTVFSADGLHPTDAGGNLYAAAIGRAFLRMKSLPAARTKSQALPLAVHPDNWENGTMLSPKNFINLNRGWQQINPALVQTLKPYKTWFDYIMKAEKPGASFTFKFKGNNFGIFDIGGPEVGQLEFTVLETDVANLPDSISDGLTNRFNRNCNNRYRGQYVFFKVPYGTYTIRCKISAEIPDKRKILGEAQLEDITKYPEKYNQSVIYLGKVLINGEALKVN